jgi:hypothetical protein
MANSCANAAAGDHLARTGWGNGDTSPENPGFRMAVSSSEAAFGLSARRDVIA